VREQQKRNDNDYQNKSIDDGGLFIHLVDLLFILFCVVHSVFYSFRLIIIHSLSGQQASSYTEYPYGTFRWTMCRSEHEYQEFASTSDTGQVGTCRVHFFHFSRHFALSIAGATIIEFARTQCRHAFYESNSILDVTIAKQIDILMV
jgi:hypothetical protein